MPNNHIPDFINYHESLTKELFAIKDRIRNLVRHWPTDGGLKEAVLKGLLRRHLPESAIVGTGFIVTSDQSSTQIDILVVDASKPTLFMDGDLLIVTPDAVLGIVEVKTKINSENDIAEVLTKLSQVEEICCRNALGHSIWSGLFVFEGRIDWQERILRSLGVAFHRTNQTINCVSWGKSAFVRYWERDADIFKLEPGPVWHSYELPEVAPSYFIGNLIDWISSVDNRTADFAWFPVLGGKEQYRRYYLPLNENVPRSFSEVPQ